MNPEDMKKLNVVDYLFVTVEGSDGGHAACMVFANTEVEVEHVKMSKRLARYLKRSTHIGIRPVAYQFVERGIPKIDDINKKVVYASKDIIEKYSNQVELINIENGYRIQLDLELKDDATRTFTNKIFINRYHMLLLGLTKSVEDRLVVAKMMKNEQSAMQKFRHSAHDFYNNAIEKLGDFFIGYRELELRIGYIYPFDENHKVARIHPNIRKFLGVQENERLVITYIRRAERLPVLDLDTKHVNEVFKVDDEFIDSHLYIGIPATTRNRLGIPNIGSVVKVRRSMKFLLMKHINKLILPLIALWFTIISLVRDSGLWLIICLILILSPIIIFASLSEERSKVK
ncbi:hypothetical protein [Pseudogracilibacillus auburnensis]|uniref:hypothetical protein n=1 Tax=Pseudogracilibacillus auburnensis TaxID=1494959 RepID=UPI001A965916|nr:hypothetical protein [Pseudogracilibacillus auburnensis]MBO1004848.1 hypothetical protein [Pseudogracilibacillus auburnensis]